MRAPEPTLPPPRQASRPDGPSGPADDVLNGSAPGAADESPGPSRRRKGRGRPLQFYIAALVALFVMAALAGAAYGGFRANEDARTAAQQDAARWARLAARDLTEEIANLQASVAQTAANPGIAQVYTQPDLCSLSFGWGGLFGGGHLDLLRPDGGVVCSSLGEPGSEPGFDYAGADWLDRAMSGPLFLGPTSDPSTGERVVIVAAPVPDVGAVVIAVELEPVAAALSTRYGGAEGLAEGLEFMVTTADAETALARSIEPARWVDTPLGDTPFSSTSRSDRPDVDGTRRLYGEAVVTPADWRVFAGVDRALAMAAAGRLFRQELVIILAGLAVVCAGAYVLYRRITSPIRRLRGAIRAAAAGTAPGPVSVTGPSEVVDLAEEFNGLLDTVDRELVERERAEEAARVSERSYRLLFEGNPMPMWLNDADSLAFLEVNEAAINHYGYSREEFLAMTITDVCPPGDPPAALEHPPDGTTIERSGPWRQIRKDGSVFEVEVTSSMVPFAGREARLVMAEDVSEREWLERRLRQSQRLESLGQLAGGVAHDFNNLLTAILSFASFVGENVEQAAAEGDAERWGSVHRDVQQIERAAARGAGLTRQLLAFARREVVRPVVLDLNEVVTGLEHLLRRTLGEHIELVIATEPDLAPVMADPSQMEQVLVNLAVNARDAMPSGGILRIDTTNTMVDQAFSFGRPGLQPGAYVQLRVSDTGVGMDRDVLERAFEPFFTTKSKGAGTGLGLATVFGIITQAGGDVLIYSEPGLGTSFRVLLPVIQGAIISSEPEAELHEKARGETILLVEDEDAIREVATRILSRNGYRVVTVASVQEAIEWSREHAGEIDLLLTDMVMPHMRGKELAARVAKDRPGIRVLHVRLHPDAGDPGRGRPVWVAGGEALHGAHAADQGAPGPGGIDEVLFPEGRRAGSRRRRDRRTSSRRRSRWGGCCTACPGWGVPSSSGVCVT